MNFICFFLLYFFKVATRTFKVTYTPHLWLAFCFHRMAWAKGGAGRLMQAELLSPKIPAETLLICGQVNKSMLQKCGGIYYVFI